MNYTLQEIIQAIVGDTPTISITDGTYAILTRSAYYNAYPNQINTELFVPCVYYNVLEKTIDTHNTDEISFVENDVFVANDWICLNGITLT